MERKKQQQQHSEIQSPIDIYIDIIIALSFP